MSGSTPPTAATVGAEDLPGGLSVSVECGERESHHPTFRLLVLFQQHQEAAAGRTATAAAEARARALADPAGHWTLAYRFHAFRELNEKLIAAGVAMTVPFPDTTTRSKLGAVGGGLSSEELEQRRAALAAWLGALLTRAILRPSPPAAGSAGASAAAVSASLAARHAAARDVLAMLGVPVDEFEALPWPEQALPRAAAAASTAKPPTSAAPSAAPRPPSTESIPALTEAALHQRFPDKSRSAAAGSTAGAGAGAADAAAGTGAGAGAPIQKLTGVAARDSGDTEAMMRFFLARPFVIVTVHRGSLVQGHQLFDAHFNMRAPYLAPEFDPVVQRQLETERIRVQLWQQHGLDPVTGQQVSRARVGAAATAAKESAMKFLRFTGSSGGGGGGGGGGGAADAEDVPQRDGRPPLERAQAALDEEKRRLPPVPSTDWSRVALTDRGHFVVSFRFSQYRELRDKLELHGAVVRVAPFPPTYARSKLGMPLTDQQLVERTQMLDRWLRNAATNFSEMNPDARSDMLDFFRIDDFPERDLLSSLLAEGRVPRDPSIFATRRRAGQRAGAPATPAASAAASTASAAAAVDETRSDAGRSVSSKSMRVTGGAKGLGAQDDGSSDNSSDAKVGAAPRGAPKPAAEFEIGSTRPQSQRTWSSSSTKAVTAAAKHGAIPDRLVHMDDNASDRGKSKPAVPAAAPAAAAAASALPSTAPAKSAPLPAAAPAPAPAAKASAPAPAAKASAPAPAAQPAAQAAAAPAAAKGAAAGAPAPAAAASAAAAKAGPTPGAVEIGDASSDGRESPQSHHSGDEETESPEKAMLSKGQKQQPPAGALGCCVIL